MYRFIYIQEPYFAKYYISRKCYYNWIIVGLMMIYIDLHIEYTKSQIYV